jgi:hypothetical protein
MIAFPKPDAPEDQRETVCDSSGRIVALISRGDGEGQDLLRVFVVSPDGTPAACLVVDRSGLPALNLIADGKLRAAIVLGPGGNAQALGFDASGEIVLTLKAK